MLNVQVGPPVLGAADLMSSQSLKPEMMKAKESSDSEKVFKDLITKKSDEAPKNLEIQSKRKDSLPRKEVSQAKPNKEVKKEEKVEKDDSPKSEPKEASKEVREKSEGRVNGPKKVRSQVINKFMDSFESEFQIPATRLVAEMTEVGIAKPELTPEETASEVIGNLGLEPDQQAQAMAMYQSLLQDLKQSTPSQLSSQGIANRQMESVTAMADLNQSIEQLTQKFWNQSDAEAVLPQGMEVLDKPLSLQDVGIDQAKLGQLQASQAQQQGLKSFQDLQATQVPLQDSSVVESNQADVDELTTGTDVHAAESDKSTDKSEGLLKGAVAGLIGKGADAQGDTAGSSLQQNFQQEQNMQKLKAMMSDLGKKAVTSSNEKFDVSQSSVSSTAASASSTAAAGATGLVKPFDPRLAAVTGNPLLAQVKSNPETEASVKEIMAQAQYLVRKGGGEMNVQMSPEGMGQVQLKVAVEDGKVSLQMAAETQDAKKVIEKSLSQLKTSLAAQKLSVDHIKIDVAQEANLSNQAQMNLNQGSGGHAQRDQARQFWNQFEQNFGSQYRDSAFSDTFQVKGYQQRPEPLKPVETARAAGQGRGSELNLVA